MAGLAPQNIRQGAPAPLPNAPLLDTDGITVELIDDAPTDTPEIAKNGDVLRIVHSNGDITIDPTGAPIARAAKPENGGWYANLVGKIGDSDLGVIANDLLRGIADDIQSRTEWIEARATGIQLMGLKIEVPGLQGASDGAPVEGMSKVRHPLLLEAVLRFQANARSELLPTDGPVKIRNDDNNTDLAEDQIANALERDLNHYLTAVATEYYPDTDRMLLMLGFGGTSFKKVHFCPLRNRPVSESVDADDLIVNAMATDLQNAKRVTHKVTMRPSTVKRMEILGVYRQIDLGTPLAPKQDSVDREKAAQQGVTTDTANPEDRDREIYECYCELDIPGFEHKHRSEVTGLEIPYRVTLDVSTQQILSVVRNYKKPEPVEAAAVPGIGHNGGLEMLPEARTTFVKYTFVPGLGFYDIGLLHILGNTTNALTAAWREMLDNGMFANFPGFLMQDNGARQNTNIFRVPPGGGALVKTGGASLKDAIMPLPYGTAHMPALQALTKEMSETGARIGGTSEQQVGEGRADAPVGTTLAMIDQATKVMNSVHKRMHAAQAEELQLLADCFREHPESFWQRKGKRGSPWDEATFLKALDDYDLVPQADPNTASHGQRVMKIMGLKQLQAASPALYDDKAIDTAAMQAMGWSNPDQFFAKQDKSPPPEILKGMAEIEDAKERTKNDGIRAQASMISAQASAQKGLAGGEGGGAQLDTDVDRQTADAKDREIVLKEREMELNNENEDLNREAALKEAAIDLAKEHLRAQSEVEVARIEGAHEVRAAKVKAVAAPKRPSDKK